MGTQNINEGLRPGVGGSLEGEGVLIPSVLHTLKIGVGPSQSAPEVSADLSNGRILEPLGPTEIVGPSLHLPDMGGRGVDTVSQEELAEGVERAPVGITMADEPVVGGDT